MVHTFLNARRRHYGTGLTPKHHNDRTNDPLNGQSLRGVFKKQYLASGAPANADRVMDAILYGRAMMPALGNTMTPQERTDLLPICTPCNRRCKRCCGSALSNLAR